MRRFVDLKENETQKSQTGIKQRLSWLWSDSPQQKFEEDSCIS